MKELLLLNPENVTLKEVVGYKVREAVRAIVKDETGKIALLFVAKENYYKLPGGGIEATEDKMTALQRECQEEIGTEVEIIDEIGSIVEYRKIFLMKQTSYCYFAKVRGARSAPTFTDEEKSYNFCLLWVSYEEARRLLRETISTAIEAYAYIVPREIKFLEEAKPHFQEQS